jgi:uncharacterized protein YkwD
VSPRRALTTFAVLIAVSLQAPAFAAARPVGDCQASADWPASSPATAADVVARVNGHRGDRGLTPLAVSPTLTAAAEWKARHMAQYGYMEHDDPAPPLQRTAFERMQACGYPEQALAGENIASGYDSPASVMEGWLGSPGHRANIERPEFQAIGVGVARSAGGTYYWTQDFGSVADAAAPPPTPPAPPPLVPAPPPDTQPVIGTALGPGVAVRIHGCRRARRSRRAVLCRLAVSRAPIVVRSRLWQRGAIVASGNVRAEHAGRLRLRLRIRGAVRRGRGLLSLRVDGARVRRPVRVR